MMKHVQSEDVLRRVRAFIGLIVFHIELHDFLRRPGNDGTTKQFMSHLSQFDFFAGQRTAIIILTRVGYCLEPAGICPVLVSCRWPVVWNHDVTVCQLLVVFTLWDAFPGADLKGSRFLQWQHYH